MNHGVAGSCSEAAPGRRNRTTMSLEDRQPRLGNRHECSWCTALEVYFKLLYGDAMQVRALRQEALMLLVDSLATVAPQAGSAARHTAFSSHLRDTAYLSDSDNSPSFIAELLRMFCETRPAVVAEFIDRYRPGVRASNCMSNHIHHCVTCVSLRNHMSNHSSPVTNLCCSNVDDKLVHIGNSASFSRFLNV